MREILTVSCKSDIRQAGNEEAIDENAEITGYGTLVSTCFGGNRIDI